jgi:hypothetical protein
VVIIYKMHIFFIITNTKAIATWGKKRKKKTDLLLGAPCMEPWTHTLLTAKTTRDYNSKVVINFQPLSMGSYGQDRLCG